MAQKELSFQKDLAQASEQFAAFAKFYYAYTHAFIAKPVAFVINTIIGGAVNFLRNIPAAITNTLQTLGQKLADISDKLAAVYGEVKTAIAKKLSELTTEFKKKVKSLFSIFNPQNADDDDKQIDETKKAFKLKTFIHDLYKKLTNEDEKDLDDNQF